MESSNKNDKNLQQKIRKEWFNFSEVDMKDTLRDNIWVFTEKNKCFRLTWLTQFDNYCFLLL